MNSKFNSTNAIPVNLPNLTFIRDGYEIFLDDSNTIFLVKDGYVHMAFEKVANKELRGIYSLYKRNIDQPVPVNCYFAFEAVPVSTEELGMEVSCAIDHAYNHKCYEDDVRKRIIELNDDYHYSLLVDMFKQSSSPSSKRLIWMDIFCSPVFFIAGKPELVDLLLFGSLRAKKKVLLQVLGSEKYDILNIQKRGRRYIDALTGRLLRHYHAN